MDELVDNRGFFSTIRPTQICHVRTCNGTFRTVVPDSLEGSRNGWLLGFPTCRHPVPPGPAAPHRTAVRSAALNSLCYVRVMDSTGCSTGVGPWPGNLLNVRVQNKTCNKWMGSGCTAGERGGVGASSSRRQVSPLASKAAKKLPSMFSCMNM